MNKEKLGISVIGCGTFCEAYLSTLGSDYDNVYPVCCSDMDMDRAQAAAKKWGLKRACTTDELLRDPETDIVLILTNPASHYELTMRALNAGKHVYCEKPMASTFEQAREIVHRAAELGLRVGCAPDTFLSSEFQTVRKLIDDDAIGKVISVTANYVGPGADMWHPNAGFLYLPGGGPVLDMAPYFFTTLISILGPIEQLFSYANRGFEVRHIQNRDCNVQVNTNYCGLLKFKDGAIANVNMSYDIWKSGLPGLEIYGTDGVIFAPDPNTMKGPIKLLRADIFKNSVLNKTDIMKKLFAIYGPESLELFEEVKTVSPRLGNRRGLGVSDMADAIVCGREPRVSAELCRHVTEAIIAFDACGYTGLPYTMTTNCAKPAPLY